MPIRIQRRREAGWRMPAGAVYVGRPTVWGNPFRVARDVPDSFGNNSPIAVVDDTDRRTVQCHFLTLGHARAYAMGMYLTSIRMAQRLPDQAAIAEPWALEIARRLPELAGRDLVCWCPLPKRGLADLCHAAVLIALANPEASTWPYTPATCST